MQQTGRRDGPSPSDAAVERKAAAARLRGEEPANISPFWNDTDPLLANRRMHSGKTHSGRCGVPRWTGMAALLSSHRIPPLCPSIVFGRRRPIMVESCPNSTALSAERDCDGLAGRFGRRGPQSYAPAPADSAERQLVVRPRTELTGAVAHRQGAV